MTGQIDNIFVFLLLRKDTVSPEMRLSGADE